MRGTDLCFGSKALIGKSDLKRQRRGRKERQEEMGLEQSWRADKVERNRKGTFCKMDYAVGAECVRGKGSGQREGTQGHCSRTCRRLKLALNFLFPAACFGVCSGDASSWELACWKKVTKPQLGSAYVVA